MRSNNKLTRKMWPFTRLINLKRFYQISLRQKKIGASCLFYFGRSTCIRKKCILSAVMVFISILSHYRGGHLKEVWQLTDPKALYHGERVQPVLVFIFPDLVLARSIPVQTARQPFWHLPCSEKYQTVPIKHVDHTLKPSSTKPWWSVQQFYSSATFLSFI